MANGITRALRDLLLITGEILEVVEEVAPRMRRVRVGGDGPGATWLRNVSAGRQLSFTRPQGGFVLRHDAPYHLFAGEETAAVAFGAMLRALPEGAPVFGAVEADRSGDHLPLPRDLTPVCREGASAAGSELLVEAVRKLDLPDGPGVAYPWRARRAPSRPYAPIW